MTNIDQQNNHLEAVPFFARYLEGQVAEDLSEAEMAAVSGGQTVYPTEPDGGIGGGAVTQKYPSDNEDGGSGGVMTKKYPSDQEDSGSGFPNIPIPEMPRFPH
ncbi:MAG: microviridin/marinostatin family tricyclic proteinase inhibitor [Acaryochloris sp. RU_4_1]|nr:microviridin/marinostatin family tricyclic proteinase inhibitor [Acaryochloris sp. RU_4_1]NJR56571.1 microviridin/marinostatin family tricyclic proteinase inhibitor [Acaryochloris sp. CRU_2_0]